MKPDPWPPLQNHQYSPDSECIRPCSSISKEKSSSVGSSRSMLPACVWRVVPSYVPAGGRAPCSSDTTSKLTEAVPTGFVNSTVRVPTGCGPATSEATSPSGSTTTVSMTSPSTRTSTACGPGLKLSGKPPASTLTGSAASSDCVTTNREALAHGSNWSRYSWS